jgi:hypothetical protein
MNTAAINVEKITAIPPNRLPKPIKTATEMMGNNSPTT